MLLWTKRAYSLHNWYIEGLIFIVMLYRGRVFGKKLSHEDQAFMNVICALTRRHKSETTSLHHVSTQWDGDTWKPGSGPSSEIESASTLISDFQSPGLWGEKNRNCYLSYPVYSIHYSGPSWQERSTQKDWCTSVIFYLGKPSPGKPSHTQD